MSGRGVAHVTTVEDPDRRVALEVLVQGAGPDVVLVPSFMRGGADYAQLQTSLAAAGYRSLALNPRGTGNSKGAVEAIMLRELADDVALVVTSLCDGPVHLVGHALGNIFVRATASYRPEVARTVTVMPPGGHSLATRPTAPEVVAAVGRCHDTTIADEERLQALRMAFFAPGNDPRSWLEGWWPGAQPLSAAIRRSDPEEWWLAGRVPMLVIQPLDDAMASVEAGREYAAALGDRARYVEVANCGHAILPEQPEAIAGHVIGFLREEDS